MDTNTTNLEYKELKLKLIEVVFDKLIYLVGSYLFGYITCLLNYRNPKYPTCIHCGEEFETDFKCHKHQPNCLESLKRREESYTRLKEKYINNKYKF